MMSSAEVSRAELPPLIPRDVLFGNPEKTSPQISPDGKYLAYLAPDQQNVMQVWLRTLGQKDDRIITADKKRGIRQFVWPYDGKHLCYLQDTDGDENFHLYAVNLETGKTRELTPFKGVRVMSIDRDPVAPNELLIAMNRQDPRKFDVYRLKLDSGDLAFDTENPGNIIGWTSDHQFKIRAAVAATPDGGHDILIREAPGKPWQLLRHLGPDDNGAPLAFGPESKVLYLLSNHDANAQRLIEVDMATKKEKVLAEDPEYDVGNVLTHPARRTPEAVSFNRDKIQWQVLDPDVKADFEALARVHRGVINSINRDESSKTWLVGFVTDDGPVYYYLYDRPTRKAEFLFSHQPKLEKLPLAKMKPIEYTSRDGLKIHGYLTTPVGVPARNLPMVLFVHGGPWARDNWGYNPVHQWLANRGYAVLSVNFRGSTGYGKKFLNAGNREWAGKMHDDLIDGVNWAIKQGIADPKRIAIMGGSYGGYATLVGLTFTPDVFAAGVDIVGPSDIRTLLNSIPPYWAPMKAMFNRRVGDVEKDNEFLKSRSPLFYVDRIKAPLLIGQGANDPRVKQAESDQIAEALRKAGKPVEYIVYTDEGHGFARPENSLHFFAKAEEFLAKHLHNSRYEPADDIKGHSAVNK